MVFFKFLQFFASDVHYIGFVTKIMRSLRASYTKFTDIVRNSSELSLFLQINQKLDLSTLSRVLHQLVPDILVPIPVSIVHPVHLLLCCAPFSKMSSALKLSCLLALVVSSSAVSPEWSRILPTVSRRRGPGGPCKKADTVCMCEMLTLCAPSAA